LKLNNGLTTDPDEQVKMIEYLGEDKSEEPKIVEDD
jgi:hypothetical protein